MGGRNSKTGLGDWGQTDFSFNQQYTDAGKFAHAGGTEDQYNSMTPEQRAAYLKLSQATGTSKTPEDIAQHDKDLQDFVHGLQSGLVTPASTAPAATSGTDGDLYAKLLSGTDDARKKAQDAYYQQATSRLDPQWNQQQEATRTRLLNQGLDPSSEAGQNEMAQFGRDKNDAYDSAMRGSVLAGNSEAHNVLKDRLQTWMAENGDKLTREQIEKGDKADSMDSIMKLIPAFLAML